ncbi:MAG: AI-2E family transporter [Candidatus Jordarchaeaceae archaeon]
MPRKIEISHRTIIFTVFFLISLRFLFLIRDIILQFFVALLIMAILNPLVSNLSKYKIPRALSILVVYLIILSFISFAIATIVPPLAEQTTAFVNNLPRLVENAGISTVISDQISQQLITQLARLPSQAAKVTLSLFSNIIGVVAVLVFAFYLLADRQRLDEQLAVLIGKEKEKEIARIIDILEKRLGNWAWGQLILMFVVGLANYIGLRLLGIPYALPLAILAGLLEIVPYIGPILAAIPAVLLGFGISPVVGLAVVALAFLIQQLENYVFVPQIMQKSTGVHPVITLLSLAIGFRLAGVVGLLISVPVFITLRLILSEYYFKKSLA